MKKYILFFILVFAASSFILGGIVWGLVKTGKIRTNTENTSQQKIIDLEELFRQLIPDEGKEVGRWDILSNLGDRVRWDSLTLNGNIWQGKCNLSWNGEVSMILKKKLEPYVWNIFLFGDGYEYRSFYITTQSLNEFGSRPLSPSDYYYCPKFPDYPFKLKKGEYVKCEGKDYLVYLNGKIPAGFGISYRKLQYDKEPPFLIWGNFRF